MAFTNELIGQKGQVRTVGDDLLHSCSWSIGNLQETLFYESGFSTNNSTCSIVYYDL